MTAIASISNGESGSSVRTKLNSLITVSNAGLLTNTVTMTAAATKLLHTTPKVLVTKLGSGIAIIPVSVTLTMTFATAVFDVTSVGVWIGPVANAVPWLTTGLDTTINAAGTSVAITYGNGANNLYADVLAKMANVDIIMAATVDGSQGGGALSITTAYHAVTVA